MSRFAGYIFLSLCFILIVACTSAPKKPSALPAAQVSKLHRMQLAPRLPVPVKSVERQQLSDTWGVSRSKGRTHEGIDIMSPRGTKVYSATEGLIADLRNNNHRLPDLACAHQDGHNSASCHLVPKSR